MTDGSLTRREGRPALGGPYEGVPDHLFRPLRLWVAEQFIKDGGRNFRINLLYKVIAWEQITGRDDPPPDKSADDKTRVNFGQTLLLSVMSHCADEEHLLDVIHTLVRLGRDSFEVDRILEAGNSVWTAEFEEGLFRRVEATATEAFEQANLSGRPSQRPST